MSNTETVIEALGDVFATETVEVDDALIERMISALTPICSEDVVMVMLGPDDSFVATYEGADGVRTGWTDWLDSFARIRFVFEGFEEIGDNVVTWARQIGTTRYGVEVEQPSAAVWKFRDGKIFQIEFHLDRDKALASAREAV